MSKKVEKEKDIVSAEFVKSLVGQNLSKAFALCTKNKCQVRVVSYNNEPFIITADYWLNRINVAIEGPYCALAPSDCRKLISMHPEEMIIKNVTVG